ncbi:unnamed protein product [Cylindrotheca closterium]|uniref:Uncharacterized protein n=1 Tax=Cylindrotheca closterium TaxID=2856 RepID=A0AAD2JHE4_9STRA|nr:unnamed protein product [Cylindrotheca closterium]
MTEITLDPLEAEAVENITTTAMSSQKDSRTKILAELCRKRTNGNPFFIVEFLKMLEAEGLLAYDTSLKKWVWDPVIIEESTMSTANVVVLLQERMRKLPKSLLHILGQISRKEPWPSYGQPMAK